MAAVETLGVPRTAPVVRRLVDAAAEIMGEPDPDEQDDQPGRGGGGQGLSEDDHGLEYAERGNHHREAGGA